MVSYIIVFLIIHRLCEVQMLTISVFLQVINLDLIRKEADKLGLTSRADGLRFGSQFHLLKNVTIVPDIPFPSLQESYPGSYSRGANLQHNLLIPISFGNCKPLHPSGLLLIFHGYLNVIIMLNLHEKLNWWFI